MNVTNIEELQKEIQKLFGILGDNINDDYYPRNARGEILHFEKWETVTFDSPIGDATPFIEMKNGQFNFLISERGEEYKRIVGNADKIIFLLFEGITFSLASKFESNNRIYEQDSRRILFSKQIELLGLLSPEWASSEIENHQRILQQHPFDDSSAIRVEYSKIHGWDKACEKYPLPESSSPL